MKSPLDVALTWNALSSYKTYSVYRDNVSQKTLISSTSFFDKGISFGETHSYYVVGVPKTGSTIKSNTVTVHIIPAAPTGLTAKGSWNSESSKPQVGLIWKASTHATSYNLYRDGARLQTGLTQTQATDLKVTSGQAYAYAVTAVGPSGESAKSGTAAATAPNLPKPAAPAGLSATPQWKDSCPKCGGMAMAHIVVAWTGVTGATSYNLYRNGVLFQPGLTKTSETDMAVVSGQLYTYQVTAIGITGESAKSSPVTATAPNPPADMSAASTLPPPANLAVHGFWQGAPSDTLTWDAVPGAAAYNVYQYDVLIAQDVPSNSYTVPLENFCSQMTYTVTAIDSMGMETIPSNIVNASGAHDPTQKPSWMPHAPATPIDVIATPEWNAGLPRIRVMWHGYNSNYTYNVYRDGQKVAEGHWGLAYFDNSVQPGETHTYSVTGVNLPWTEPVESAPSANATATALAGAPALSDEPLQVNGVQADDDSALVSFDAVPGAVDYRVYDVKTPHSVKYSGGGLSIQMNGIDPATGANLVVEAVDKLGPFQKMDGAMGPGAMAMGGGTASAINGQGDPSDVPNVIAKSAAFHVNCQPRTLIGGQAFLDNFRNEQPLVASKLDPAVAALSGSWFEVTGAENDKWRFVTYGADTDMSKLFFMGNHFMDTTYDGPTAATRPFSHNNNTSMVMSPKAVGDISGGKVLHVTFEVDAHFDSRRWCDVFVTGVGDPILDPGKFTKSEGGNNYATASGDLFRWEIRNDSHRVQLFHEGTDTNLIQLLPKSDPQPIGRSTLNGTMQDMDKRHRFDLYLSQTRYRIVETTLDGTQTIVRDKQFPAGTVLPFTQCQVSFLHQLYHTANDRPEQVNVGGASAYWYNYRPWSDERHWDNMGFEVLPTFPN